MNKKVLVPLDGSELAECALNHAKDLFRDGSIGEITLLNIVKIDISLPQGHTDAAYKSIDINEIREKVFLSVRKYLAGVESRLASEGIKVKTEALEANHPAQAITEYAQKNGMDMIIIATHGYTGMKGMMLGSVAFGVLHQSHVPVLLIRPEACQV